MKKLFLIIIFLMFGINLYATNLPTIVITPTGYETNLNKVGSSVFTISSNEIEKGGYTTISEILNTIPGITSVTAGFGGTPSLYARGHDSDQTKIMLDGIDLNDPSAIGTSPVLSTLIVDNIDRIEVVLGPQSLLSGADAMGGAINIITKKYNSFNQASLSTGSEDTDIASVNYNLNHEDYNFSVNMSEFKTKGINVAVDGSDDRDSVDQSSINFNLNRQLEDFIFFLSYKNQEGRSEYDDTFGGPRSVPIYADNDYTFIKAGVDLDLSDSSIFKFEYNKSEFNRNDISFWGKTDYYGDVEEVKANYKLNYDNRNIILFGLEYETEKYTGSYAPSSNNSDSVSSLYIQDEHKVDSNTSLLLGIRLDNHDRYGNHETYRLTLNHALSRSPGLILKASLGTGFRAPSLYELYDSTYGNANLKPEMSFGYDIGFINYISPNLNFGSTFFKSEIEDSIEYSWLSGYYQSSGISVRDGLETFINYYPNERSEVKISHSHLKTSESEIIRRPNNSFTLAGSFNFSHNIDLYGDMIAVEDHFDTSSEINGYEVINFGIDYRASQNATFSLKINNVTDEYYQPLVGYNGHPRQGLLKVNYVF